MNSENQNQEKLQMEQAGKNTAHLAGKAAATYFGGTLGNIAYDKLSQTKIGQKLETGVGKVISKTPVLNKLNKGLNDSGAVDVANKAVDMLGAKKPSSSLARRGLTASKGNSNNSPANKIHKNSSSDTPNALEQNAKRRASFNGKNNSTRANSAEEEKTDKDNTSKDEEQESENESQTSSSTTLSPKSIKAKILTAKVVLALAGVFIAIIITLVILSPIISLISSVASFFSSENHNSDNPSLVNNNVNPELLEAEIKYNDALVGSKDGSVKGIIAEIEEKYGVTIDRYMLQAVLMYRFFGTNIDLNDELTDEEIEESIEDLDELENEENSGSNSNGINVSDYEIALKNMRTVAEMMIFKPGDEYSTDISVGGNFYNTLIDSSFLTSYYKNLLVDNEYETRKALVDDIFNYADIARTIVNSDGEYAFLSDTAIIYMQVCRNMGAGYYRTKNINGINVFDNPLINKGTQYPLYFTFTNWLKGVMEGEVGDYLSEDYREGIKAMMVAASSYMLGDTRSGFDLRSGVMYYPTGNCRQVSCDPVNGCSYVKLNNEHGTAYSGYNRYSTGNHEPLSESQNKFLDSVMSEVFGEVMVTKGVTSSTFRGSKDIINGSYYMKHSSCGDNCLGQEEAMKDAKNGLSYREILNKYYKNFDILNIREGLYYDNANSFDYNGTIQLNEDFHYHQGDSPWGGQTICGSDKNISTSGCNVTSAAIAISLLKNQKITPETLNNRQSENSFCSPSSRPQMIKKYIEMYGLNVTVVNVSNSSDTSQVQDMLSKIATGNYVAVVRIKKNEGDRYKTRSGHYITIVGVKSENGKQKVLVWDPGSKSKERDNYWADLNTDILQYVNSEYSFILAGR